jgi:hypothetical protein
MISTSIPYTLAKDTMAEAGMVAYRQGKYKQAVKFLSSSLKTNPDNLDALYYFANSLVMTHKLDHARKYYNKVIEIDPTSIMADYSKVALNHIGSYKGSIRIPYDSLLLKGTDLYTSENSYILNVTRSGPVTHWDQSTMPLKVYIETPYFEEHKNYMWEAFNKWEDLSQQLVAFEETHMSDDAHILVKWVKRVPEEKEMDFYGVVTPQTSEKELEKFIIYMAEADEKGNLILPSLAKAAMLHHIGHALGISAHSDNVNDIMSPENTQGDITRRDLATLNLLYDFKPVFSNFQEAETLFERQSSQQDDNPPPPEYSPPAQPPVPEVEEMPATKGGLKKFGLD